MEGASAPLPAGAHDDNHWLVLRNTIYYAYYLTNMHTPFTLTYNNHCDTAGRQDQRWHPAYKNTAPAIAKWLLSK